MCGIAGLLLTHGVDAASTRANVRRMTEQIRHRGPDGAGVHFDDGACLGHRRLSILDTERGGQPFVVDGGAVALAYNGEIYNFRALRDELVGRGHSFTTDCDTEVLTRAWQTWGADALRRLDGMFAFAVWEPRRQRLTLVRDRLGIKPLYWAHVGGAIAFGSELDAVMASGLVPGDIDEQAIDEFFAYGYIGAPRSIFRAVRKLGPGTLVSVERGPTGGLSITEQVWWRLPDPSTTASESFVDAKARLRDVLGAAVRSHLVSDVPLGAFLSGGIDSTAVVALAREAVGPSLETFSIGFDDPAYDETAHARAVASHLGTVHHELRIGPEAVADLPALVHAMDEPFGDPSLLPTWHVAKLARTRITVALSGDGGDELFAGYTRYAHLDRELRRLGVVPQVVRRAVSVAARLFEPEGRRRNLLERVSLPPEAHYARFRSIFSEEMRGSLFAESLLGRVDMAKTRRVFAGLTPGMRSGPAIARLQAADLTTYLHDDVLTKVDRMSMLHSLEVRVPLLDHHVVEFAAGLPPEYKQGGGMTKRILRELVHDFVPASIMNRPKQGFSLPVGSWLRRDLRALMDDAVGSRTYRDSGWFRPGYVERLWATHRSGRQDLSWPLWQVLVFHLWNERTRPGLVAWSR